MKCYKKSILLVIIISFVITCKQTKNFEKESNNTFATANTIEIDKEIYGYLDSENDVDDFTLNIVQEQILKLELSAVKGVNHAINIYRKNDNNFQLLKVIDDNRKSASEIFANLYVYPGQYFFTISHGSRDIKKGNNENPYKLIITSRSFLGEEKEPNDTPYAATEIFNKIPVSGFFSPGRNSLNSDSENMMKETDWYKFNLSVPYSNPFLIDIKLSGVTGVDSVISLFNSRMERILTIDNAGAGEAESLSDFGIKESGIYYINITSKNFLFNHDIPYELKLDIKQFDAGSELEPNDSYMLANEISNNSINGKINSSKDIDYYRFTPQAKNEYYRMICSGSEKLDLTMTIYDQNRNKLFEINNFGSGESEKIPPFILRNSIYIMISAASAADNESKYKLEVIKYDPLTQIEQEPNNTKLTATILNKKITGFINSKSDIDYFLVQYEKRHKVKLTVKGIKNGKIRVSTTDPQGFIIKSKDIEPDAEISYTEIFDKKGFIIIEPVIPDYDSPYFITVED